MIIDDENMDNFNENNQLPIQTQNTQPDIQTAKISKFRIPKMLKRLSATYFGIAN